MLDKIINTSFFDENSVGHNASDALDKIRRWYTLLSKNALIADCGEKFYCFHAVHSNENCRNMQLFLLDYGEYRVAPMGH